MTARSLMVLAVLVAGGCGKPEVKGTHNQTYVLETRTTDAAGMHLVIHPETCPTEQHRITVPPSADPAVTKCLEALAIGSTISAVDYSYRRPLISIGGGDLPTDTLGGCAIGSVSGVQYLVAGKPCP